MRNLLQLGALAVALGAAVSLPGLRTQADGERSAAAALHLASTRRITTAGDNVKPFVVVRPQGGAYLAWVQRSGQHTTAFFARSTDGVTFGAPVHLSPGGMDLDLGAEDGPQVAVDGKGRIYVVWAAGSWAATPSSASAAQSSHTGHGGHGGQGGAPPRPGNLDIYLVTSSDDGRTFSAPRRVNDDPEGPEHRFPTVAAESDGAVYVVWLDKRKQTPARPDYSRAYLAKSADGGKTFAPNVDVTEHQEDPICHCCKLAVAAHSTEGLFIAFRNCVSDRRDMFLVRSADGARTVSQPAPIEDTRWIISYCPMAGPSLALDGAGSLHAVWPTGGKVGDKPLLGGEEAPFKVLYRRFDARKRAWGPSVCLAGGTHPRVAVSPDGVPFIAWRGEGIQVAQLTADGTPAVLALSPPTASGGYPSLALTPSGDLFVAWQQSGGDGSSQVYFARVVRTGGGG